MSDRATPGSRMRGVLTTTALVIGVTVGSVAIGAGLVSPVTAKFMGQMMRVLSSITPEQYAIGGGVVTFALMLTVLTPRLLRRRAPSTGAIAAPTLSFSRNDRTPRAVQALAQQGAQPTEIAWRTGLPVDAVSLLLAMSTASRQLQPPTN